jgi:hypothetical protein
VRKSWMVFLRLIGAISFVIGLFAGVGDAKDEPRIAIGKAGETQTTTATSKPSLKVEKDGFPGGHETPEGAACDLARAFINRDARLFKETCIPPFGGGDNQTRYADFLKQTEAVITAEAAKKQPSPGGPRQIGKLYAARHLSKNGPASTGYALFDFQDVMFVDVGVFLHNGQQSLNRTLVIKKDGSWYVHPAPQTTELLSMGLNDEAASKIDFSDAYEVKR